MMKVIPLILCSIALCTNGSLNSSNYNQTYFEDPIQESDIYEETIIGSAPNESKVSGYSQDFKEISKNSSYSTANMVNYDVETGTTSFEYFNQNSYPIRTSSNALSLNYSVEPTNLLDDSDETILTSEGFIPDDASYSISTNSILGTDDRVQVTNPSTWPY